jgi:hypothetical protein
MRQVLARIPASVREAHIQFGKQRYLSAEGKEMRAKISKALSHNNTCALIQLATKLPSEQNPQEHLFLSPKAKRVKQQRERMALKRHVKDRQAEKTTNLINTSR